MRRERKKTPFIKSKAAKIVIAVLAVIIFATGAFACVIYPGDKIAKGVSVNGVKIGGMTKSQAEDAVFKALSFKEGEIKVTDVSGAETVFTTTDAGICPDIDKTIEAAYGMGRNEGLIKDILTLSRLIFVPENIKCIFSYDEERLPQTLYDFGVSVNGQQENYNLEYGDGYVKLKKGKNGQSRDVSDLVQNVLDSVARGEYNVAVTLKNTEPPEPTAQSIYDEIYVEPQDAKCEMTKDSMVITPEVVGQTIDKAEAEEKLAAVKAGEQVTLRLTVLNPSVTEASINSEYFGYTLGEFSTSYATSSKNRAENVELAAKRINGIVLMPDGEFSYNKAVGKRTEANGFKSAPVFENGETVQGLGGGVCQVSSTLYSAVLYADLQVVERRNHSLIVSYVPKGQDATVAYGSIDFRFKNNTKNPVRILATTGGGKIRVALLGTKPEKQKKVQIINSVTETKNPTEEVEKDATMKAGQKKVLSGGKTGYTVSTVRKVFEDGKEVKSEKMPSSKYKMVPTKVAVGTLEETVPTFNDTQTDKDTAKNTEKEAEPKSQPQGNPKRPEANPENEAPGEGDITE